MTEKQRFPLARARSVAAALQLAFSPYVERIEIAGSIRRGREDVGDIELLYVPRLSEPPADLFGTPVGEPEDALDGAMNRQMKMGEMAKRPNKDGHFTYGPKNKLLIHRASGIPVDLFRTDQANWGMAMVVRTGPAAFNVQLMARFKTLGMAGHAYAGVTYNGAEVDCPTEREVFRHAQWDYLEPQERG